jgi:hypothetical protein
MEREHLDDIVIGGRIRLTWILKKLGEKAWVGLFWLRTWTGGGLI